MTSAQRRAAKRIDAKRKRVRQSVALWLEETRAMMVELYGNAWLVANEVRDHPDGEVARVLGPWARRVIKFAVEVSNADSEINSIYLAPLVELPDPVAASLD